MKRSPLITLFVSALVVLILPVLAQDDSPSVPRDSESSPTPPPSRRSAVEEDRSEPVERGRGNGREEPSRGNSREKETPPSRRELPVETRGREGEGYGRSEERGRGEHEHRKRPYHAERGEPRIGHGEEREKRMRHLLEAAEHLELAGFPEEARRFHERARELGRERIHPHRGGEPLDDIRHQLGMIRDMISDLKRENAELREALGDLQRRR